MSDIQKKLQSEMDKYKQCQKDYQKTMKGRQQLEAQLTENNIVKEELNHLEEGATVYKLIGPVLVKQELSEARQNVAKRIEYIGGEIKRHESTLEDLEKKQTVAKETLMKIQQQVQVKAAMKA